MSDTDSKPSTPSTSAAEKITSSEGGDTGKDYDRGENQKPTTDTYRANWESIFGNSKKKTRKRK